MSSQAAGPTSVPPSALRSAAPAWAATPLLRRRQRLRLLHLVRDHAVNDPVPLRLLRRHEEVALHVALDLLHRPPRVLRVEHVHLVAEVQNLLRLNLDVRRAPLRAPRGRGGEYAPTPAGGRGGGR